MAPTLREQVRSRAGGRCEYCHLPEEFDDSPFCLDHVIARKHHGPTTFENLAFSCYWCNVFKGENLSGIDPGTGILVRLFHPRNDAWAEHFTWEGTVLTGLTDVGRTTIDVLSINALMRIDLRSTLLAEGVVL
jgi:hypothetical protein